MKFFCAKEFFYMIFDFKIGCKNEFKDNNEKSCCATAMPTAWELNLSSFGANLTITLTLYFERVVSKIFKSKFRRLLEKQESFSFLLSNFLVLFEKIERIKNV